MGFEKAKIIDTSTVIMEKWVRWKYVALVLIEWKQGDQGCRLSTRRNGHQGKFAFTPGFGK